MSGTGIDAAGVDTDVAARRRHGSWRWSLAVAVAVVLVVEVALRLFLPTALRSDGYPSRDVMLKLSQIDRWDPGTDVDIVLVGSSVVQRGLDPSAFAAMRGGDVAAVYNAGLRSATITDTAFWAQRILVPELRPEVVVIGLSDFGMTTSQCRLCFASNTSTKVRLGEATAVASAANDVSWLFRYRGTIQRPWLAYRSIQIFRKGNIEHLDARGFAAATRLTDVSATDELDLPDDFASGSELLDDLIAWLVAEGVTPVLVEMPVLKGDGSAEYGLLAGSWRSIADKYGVEFISPSDDFYDPAWYADPVHLNAQGAAAFSTFVSNSLMESLGN